MGTSAHTAATASRVRELREMHTAYAAAIHQARAMNAHVVEDANDWLMIESADLSRLCRICLLDTDVIVVNGFEGWLHVGSVTLGCSPPLSVAQAAVAHYLRSGR